MKNRILELVPRDRAAAIDYYYESYLPTRREQDKLLNRFHQLVASETTRLHEAAERNRKMAMYGLAALFLVKGGEGDFSDVEGPGEDGGGGE